MDSEPIYAGSTVSRYGVYILLVRDPDSSGYRRYFFSRLDELLERRESILNTHKRFPFLPQPEIHLLRATAFEPVEID